MLRIIAFVPLCFVSGIPGALVNKSSSLSLPLSPYLFSKTSHAQSASLSQGGIRLSPFISAICKKPHRRRIYKRMMP
ncbi:hypothetical protein F5X96DRAFT_180071 [Biscogniauxia mediterranea]|nr:hypothetical protein F5X96DRAFT_180071 [Biscogniauxia mediterranea]